MSDEQCHNSGRRPLAVDEDVFRLYDRLIGDVHLPTVLTDVAEVVCQDLGAERATVYVIEPDTQELRSTALVGNVSREIRIPISDTSLAGYCAMSGRAFVVPDAYGDLGAIHGQLRFDRRWDEMNDFRTRDVMCSPVRFKGRTLGVVQAVNSRSEPFREADLAGLCGISRLIGYALYHAKLYDDLATMKRLEQEKAEFMRIMVHLPIHVE
jgi:GAF domain-containing protein